MMHNDSIIVALTNEDKKPYREFNYKKLHDKCKTSEVILPFDTDYQILIKNENSTRIKLHIDVDGTIISGNGLVVNSHSSSYIERFLDVAKKLHFTKKTNEKVADPSNEENGFLTIKVVKEKVQPWIWARPLEVTDYSHPNDYWKFSDPYRDQARWLIPPTHYYGGSGNMGIGGMSGSTLSCSSGPGETRSINASASSASLSAKSVPCSYTASINFSHAEPASQPEVGATVEGDKSTQSFITTSWYADEEGSDFIFRFKMLGKGYSPEEEKELAEYKRLKAKFNNL